MKTLRRSINKTSVTDMVDVKYLHLYFVLRQRTSSKCDRPLFRMTTHHVHVTWQCLPAVPNIVANFRNCLNLIAATNSCLIAALEMKSSQNVCAVPSPDLSLFSTTNCSLLRLIVRSGLDVPTFATRRLHTCHHARAPSGGRWNCGREMSDDFA